MTTEQLKTDFSKRYGDSAKLVFTHSGMPVTLLGDISGSSLTCAVSMGVLTAARRTNTGYIRIESTNTNICSRIKPQHMQFPFEADFNGADILIHSNVIKGLDDELCVKAALTKTLLRLNHIRLIGADTAAHLCDGGRNTDSYRAIMGAKRGYCTYADEDELRPYPLPVTGMLFVCVSWGQRKKSRTMPKEFIENEALRMIAARRALKAYRFSEFAESVRQSALDSLKHLDLSREQRLLVRDMPGIDGCVFAKADGNHVIALSEEAAIDYVAGCVRNKFETVFGEKPRIAAAKKC